MRTKSIYSICTVTVGLSVLSMACGKDDNNDGDDGLGVPASIVTEAQLTPGALVAFDADEIKSEMEDTDSSFFHNNPREDDNECFTTALNEIKFQAEGSVLIAAGEADLSDCYKSLYQANEGFEDADFSELVASSTIKYAVYLKCEGADLSAYNGKALFAVESVPECLTAPSVTSKSENASTTSISGKIKNVKVSEQTKTYHLEQESTAYNATRTADGAPCTATLSGAEFTWDSCFDTSLSVDTKNKTGIEGSEEDDKNVGKGTYMKLEYVGLKQAANNTAVWYAGGSMNVAYNDWTGTVKYSSPTAEPIFEMKKGTETVTGTMKAPSANLSRMIMRKLLPSHQQ